MLTLEYSGRMSVKTNEDGTLPQAERDKLHDLLDLPDDPDSDILRE